MPLAGDTHEVSKRPEATTAPRGVDADSPADVNDGRPFEQSWTSPPAILAAQLGSDPRSGLTTAATHRLFVG